ncbi:MAG: SMP-30/gluconolactonase/LRE family protein [Pseudomonadota bacterium]|nr:SMP-30/gluconolactonase/LRE family protein [Pseudomonadota bacterium]
MIKAEVFDTRTCELGEGAFWHPTQERLYWFDILGDRLLSRDGDQAVKWAMNEHCSAAGWIDDSTLLIASETGLWRFDTANGSRDLITPLEANDPTTRSNDGRADPHGGFWIGTMGKRAETGRGAIYRFYLGTLRKVVSGITIPNSICFTPDGGAVYFTDTTVGQIMYQPLDDAGWPTGAARVFLDLGTRGIHPDGSVVDGEGALWNAQWGLGRVVRYLPDGTEDIIVTVGGAHSSCPAFGGPDLQTLFVTTACEGIENPDTAQGRVYTAQVPIKGRSEPRVIL